MALNEDLVQSVAKIFRDNWSIRDGRGVPDVPDLQLGNDAVKLDATVLYADMSESTKLVDGFVPQFAAEVYKAYLDCAARIIRSEGGSITAYDGDRIMAVFIGDWPNTTAARAAMRINYAVHYIINPGIKAQYSATNYQLSHVVGLDTSTLHVAKIGIRNNSDLVWVGRAANHAAKLCAINEANTTFITEEVFNKLSDAGKFGGDPKQAMWTARTWTPMANKRIYSSTWWWRV